MRVGRWLPKGLAMLSAALTYPKRKRPSLALYRRNKTLRRAHADPVYN